MASIIVIGALALFIAAGIVGFAEWRSRKAVGARYTTACVFAALLGMAAVAYCFCLGFAPGAIAVGAIIALSQQNRIESFLVRGHGPRIRITGL
jgi:hypothetical protein